MLQKELYGIYNVCHDAGVLTSCTKGNQLQMVNVVNVRISRW